MKKAALILIVIILLAVSVVPVMAAKGDSNGNGNGHGQGVGVGQSNSDGDRDRTRDQDRVQQHSSTGSGVRGAHGNLLTGKRAPFYLQGRIEAVGANSVTVEVIHANAKAKQYIGSNLIVQVTSTTLIYKHTQGEENTSSSTNDEGDKNKFIIPLAQLETGKLVAIHGNLVEGIYTARLITEYLGNFLGEAAGSP